MLFIKISSLVGTGGGHFVAFLVLEIPCNNCFLMSLVFKCFQRHFSGGVLGQLNLLSRRISGRPDLKHSRIYSGRMSRDRVLIVLHFPAEA